MKPVQFFATISAVIGILLIGTVTYASSQTISTVTILEQEELSPLLEQNTVNINSIGGGQLLADQSDTGQQLVPLRGYTTNVTGIISDLTGTLDLRRIGLVVYRSGANGGKECAANANSCYRVEQCEVEYTEYTQQRAYTCAFSLLPWADSTDSGGKYPNEEWVIGVTAPNKESGERIIVAEARRDLQSVMDIEQPSSANFGIQEKGAITDADSNVDVVLAQDGNTASRISIQGEDLSCSGGGTIPVERIRWSLDDVGYDSDNTTDLTEDRVDTGLVVGYNDTGIENGLTEELHLNLAVPTVGVKGDCVGVVTVLTEPL